MTGVIYPPGATASEGFMAIDVDPLSRRPTFFRALENQAAGDAHEAAEMVALAVSLRTPAALRRVSPQEDGCAMGLHHGSSVGRRSRLQGSG